MSVASFAPKSKTYSKTESLDSRVAIAAGIQILGYEIFWQEIYDEFGLEMDTNLRLFFRKLQQKKDKKPEMSGSNEGKSISLRNGVKNIGEVSKKVLNAPEL